jgi:hypothetical protein
MRLLEILVGALFLITAGTGTGVSGTAITLMPSSGGKTVETYTTNNYTGSCGRAAVLIYGVKDPEGGGGSFFTVDYDSAKIIVRTPPPTMKDSAKQIELTPYDALSDYNGIACVKRGTSSRLVVWSLCAGSGCPQELSFYVIDPDVPALVAPAKLSQKCDKNCAAKVLGGKLPPQAKMP